MSYSTQLRHVWSVCLTGLLGLSAVAQQPLGGSLSLADARAQAQAHNPTLKQQQAAVALAQADKDQTLGVFLPRLSVSETAVYTNAPLNAFGFKLQQERVAAADFDPNLLNDPGDVQNYLTQAELQVPLVNVNGWRYREAANQGLTARQYQLQYAQATVNYYVAEVYYGIQVVRSSRQVLQQAQATLAAALKYVADNVEAGYAQRSDELAVRVRASEVEAELLRLDDREAYYWDQLNRLLGAPKGTAWSLTDSLALAPAPGLPTPEFDLSQRADHQAYTLALRARTTAYQASQTGALPSLNAFGQYSLYDTNPFGASGQNYLVGVQLKWDLFTGFTRKSDLARKAAEYDATQAEYDAYQTQAQAEWAQAWRSLAIEQQELARAELADAQAREAYRIRSDRFQQGLEKTFDLLAAETTQAEQALRLRQARYNYYLAHEKLALLGTPATTLTQRTP